MSRTLFWYIFKDLLRIFGLASGVLSAIMSFGGLLRPLYEVGLDLSQVGKILGWSGPAMTAYSLPIAALFATTIVYGRLSADNEVTACRAAGISHLAMSGPAFVLGIFTALASVGLLCFIVPYTMLRVERIIYSNMAQLVVGQIERTHRVHFDRVEGKPMDVFARSAQVLPLDPAKPLDQALRMEGAVIAMYEEQKANQPRTNVPEDFYTSSEAIVSIHQGQEADDVTFSADLLDGMKFPRLTFSPGRQNSQFSVQEQKIGPLPLPSPVEEKTQFMNVFRLRDLLEHPESSRKVAQELHKLVLRDQQHVFLQSLADSLNGPEHRAELVGSSERYQLFPSTAPAELQARKLVMAAQNGPPVRLEQTQGPQSLISAAAREIGINAFPDTPGRRMQLEIELLGCDITQAGETSPSRHQNVARPISVPMPPEIAALNDRPATAYFNASISLIAKQDLLHALRKLKNSVFSELHSRMSFATSCFILVMMGCALGMMFRSGNFLSAFAVSVVPALLTIALIVAGQQTATNIPWTTSATYHDPLPIGIILIWIGNGMNLLAATILLARLQWR